MEPAKPEEASVDAVQDALGRWSVIVTITGERRPPIPSRNEIEALVEAAKWKKRLGLA